MNNSFSADYQYILKEVGAMGRELIWGLECYPQNRQLPFKEKNAYVCIHFKADTSEVDAKEIERLLNKHVDYTSVSFLH